MPILYLFHEILKLCIIERKASLNVKMFILRTRNQQCRLCSANNFEHGVVKSHLNKIVAKLLSGIGQRRARLLRGCTRRSSDQRAVAPLSYNPHTHTHTHTHIWCSLVPPAVLISLSSEILFAVLQLAGSLSSSRLRWVYAPLLAQSVTVYLTSRNCVVVQTFNAYNFKKNLSKSQKWRQPS